MKRPVIFLVNGITDLTPQMTTAELIHEAARRGHPTGVATVGGVDVTDDALRVRQRAVTAGADVAATLAALATAPVTPAPLAEQLVLVRTNPARDPRAWAHQHLLDTLRLAKARGVEIINDPDGLSRASSKLYLSRFPPSVRPETLVSSDPAALRAFCEAQAGPTILKPLLGTRGRDVFRVSPGDVANLNQILDVLTRDGVALAQSWLPEAVDGDTRVVLLDGRPLFVDGQPCAVQRRPPQGDFRSNVAIGGTAAQVALSEAQLAACEIIGAQLVADGVRLAGLDFIGARVVEINVFSTGGLHDAGRFGSVAFAPAVLDALLGP